MPSERKQLEGFYTADGSAFTHSSNVISQNSHHRITDAEFEQAIANNQNMSR